MVRASVKSMGGAARTPVSPSTGATPGLVRAGDRPALSDYNIERAALEDTRTPGGAARIRTQVANELFRGQHGRDPVDDRERAGFLARASRQQTTAVAGYDLTFTPVKSVSTLWALADREQARWIGRAHDAAVEHTGWLERRGTVHPPRPRRGPAGARPRTDRGHVHPSRRPVGRPEPALSRGHE